MSQRSILRLFMHRLTNADLEWFTVSERGIVMTMRLVEPNLTGDALREKVAELLPTESLFGEDARKFTAPYQEIKDFLTRRNVNLVQHSSHQIGRPLENGLYVEPEERESAERLALDIKKGKSSISSTVSLPLKDSGVDFFFQHYRLFSSLLFCSPKHPWTANGDFDLEVNMTATNIPWPKRTALPRIRARYRR